MEKLIRRAAAVAAVLVMSGAALAQDKPDAKPAPVKISPPKDEKAADVTLKVGDKAPAFTVDSFVKGEAITGFEKGRVYVVEFWATWCPPCRAAIPHLTELQKEHKEVVFVGVASSEKQKDKNKDDRLDNLKKFVDGQGDKMDYRVAYDSKRAMSNGWMKPAGKGGIPCTFIVDKEGKVAWIGHPSGMDKPLEDIIAGKTPSDKPKVIPSEPAKDEKPQS